MARFWNLPRAVLSIVARYVVQSNHRVTLPSLDLLPLRFVHPHFYPAITAWIFHTCRIKADESVTLDTQRRTFWNKASLFLPRLKVPAFSLHVTNLIFTIEGPEGVFTATSCMKLHQCVAALLAARRTVRSIDLSGQVLDTPEYRQAWETLTTSFPNLDATFDRLESVKMGGCYLPLLPRFLRQSPCLRKLYIGNDSNRITMQTLVYSAIVERDVRGGSRPTPLLDLLCVNNASNHGMLNYLEKLSVSAKEIQLSVSIWNPIGIDRLVDGISYWPMFAHVKRVSVRAEEQARWRLAPLERALRHRNIEVEFEEQELRFPSVDESHAVYRRNQARRNSLWSRRAP